MSGERTEQATPQRRKKAAEQGDSVRSRELTSAVAFLAGLTLVGSAAPMWSLCWKQLYSRTLDLDLTTLDSPDRFVHALGSLVLPSLRPVAGVMGAAFFAALASGVLQSGGLNFRPAAVAFKSERLSPAGALKQIFSTRSLLRLLKSMVPAAVVLWLAGSDLRSNLLTMPVMSFARPAQTLSAAFHLALATGWVSLCWALLDYGVEWSAWQKRLRMSKQEIREEARDSNGNPQIKGRIRQIQMAMRRRRVRADISRATVVITNPTHYAVALQFSFETMEAPKVLAKGRDLHAAEIREEARWAGVPLVENPPLARSLYRSVKEGQSIPLELYAAVAAILAYLYRREQAQNAAPNRANAYSPFSMIPNRLSAATSQDEEIV